MQVWCAFRACWLWVQPLAAGRAAGWRLVSAALDSRPGEEVGRTWVAPLALVQLRETSTPRMECGVDTNPITRTPHELI